MSPKRTTQRTVKVIPRGFSSDISVRPLAVILYSVHGETEDRKAIFHKEPFGQLLCLSDFRSGFTLAWALPDSPVMGHLKGLYGDDWTAIAVAFLENSKGPDFTHRMSLADKQPAINGGH